VKKYFLLILSFIIFSVSFFTFLQNPEYVSAAGTNVPCTCDHAGVAGQGQNGYKCGGFTGACGNKEDACVTKAGNVVQQGNMPDPNCSPAQKARGTCPTVPINYTGVACQQGKTATGQNTVQCQCTGGKNAQGKPTSIQCRNNTDVNPTWKTYSCGGAAVCVTGAGLFYTWTDNGSIQVQGIACEQNCKCDHPGPGAGSSGDGNNGWKCYDASGKLGSSDAGSCSNKEDYCVQSATATNGVTCKNSTSCSCGGNSIDCNATVYDTGGTQPTPEIFDYDCGDGQCKSGAGVDDPNFKAFNQHITGVACAPKPTLPPPPSPPCLSWSNGQCTSFNSALGAFSTNPAGFIRSVFGILLSISGGIALLLVLRAGYQLMTSRGNPEQVNAGRDQLIAAIVGLLFLIFAFVFLQLIGFDLLHIPGFSGDTSQQNCSCVPTHGGPNIGNGGCPGGYTQVCK
jgi:hypothetical protein